MRLGSDLFSLGTEHQKYILWTWTMNFQFKAPKGVFTPKELLARTPPSSGRAQRPLHFWALGPFHVTLADFTQNLIGSKGRAFPKDSEFGVNSKIAISIQYSSRQNTADIPKYSRLDQVKYSLPVVFYKSKSTYFVLVQQFFSKEVFSQLYLHALYCNVQFFSNSYKRYFSLQNLLPPTGEEWGVVKVNFFQYFNHTCHVSRVFFSTLPQSCMKNE